MDKTTLTDSNQPTPTYDTHQPLGERLRQAREKKGLSIDQAAEQTFIMKRHIEALEQNNYEQLPQPTFARGFAVNYGRFLGLDATMVGQSFDAQYPSQLKQQHETVRHAPQPIGTLQRDGGANIKINWFIIGSILAALVLAFYIFSTVNKAHNDSEATPVTTSVQGINNQEQATGADLNNAGSAIPTTTLPASGLPATGSAITGVAIDTASTATSLPASVAVGSVNTTPAVGSSTLSLWVQKPTTLSITDANGQVLVNGELPRGAKDVSGKAPFKISIQDVSSVSLDYNKQPIKLSDYAQNNQANFTLN